MLLGTQLAFLTNQSFNKSLEIFFELQRQYGLNACEVQLEASLYEAAVWPWDVEAESRIRDELRGKVERLGVHLPFMGLNPISDNPCLLEMTRKMYEDSMKFSKNVGADYVVFHARGKNYFQQELNNDAGMWLSPIREIANMAKDYNLTFCLENADNLHDIKAIKSILLQNPDIKLCFDIGHLYERHYPDSLLHKALLHFNDHYSISPFLMKTGLSTAYHGEWHEMLPSFRKRMGCVHLHNHNGIMAHRPVTQGKLDFKYLAGFQNMFDEVPLIVESDYHTWGISTIRKDLEYIQNIF